MSGLSLCPEMELDPEQLTEAYSLSLGDSRYDSCQLTLCHALRGSLHEGAPTQTQLKALLREVATAARIGMPLIVCLGQTPAGVPPAAPGRLHLRATGRGPDGSPAGTADGPGGVSLRLRLLSVRLSFPAELPCHSATGQILHHGLRHCPVQP